MIAQRRFGLLMGLAIAGLAVIYLRMFQVQVVEHGIWAREAANLVRTSETLPYHRGRILDRKGRVLVQDDDAYEVELVYRDFRREHPLGQVAHARSALEMRAVSLHRAARELVPWALELVGIRPGELEAFARGAPLELASLALPAADPEDDQRAARSGEVRFYTRALLGLTHREWTLVGRLVEAGGGARSYLELAADVRGESAATLANELADRLRASLGRLEQLAWLLGTAGEEDAPPSSSEPLFSSAEELVRLIEHLQRTRDGVEDAIASELFRLAAGFPPARIGPELLLQSFDLEWIAASLRWDEARAELWTAAVRDEWESSWRALFVEAATIRATLADAGGAPAERLLDQYAALYDAEPRGASWREVERTIVLDELGALFADAEASSGPGAGALPFRDPALRARSRAGEEPWATFAAAVIDPGPAYLPEGASEEAPWHPPASAEEAALRFRRCFDSDEAGNADARADRRDLPGWFVAGWELRFQELLATRLEELAAAADPRPLAFTAARRERALEQRAYVVRDRGSRPVEIELRPSYDVVQLLTRYPEEFRGFAVRRTMRRRAVAVDEAGRPVAPELLGVVRESSLREVIEQRERARRLSDLRHQAVRSERDREEMRGLVAELFRSDEVHGTSGIEGLYDELLRGENGYRESEGLQERAGERREAFFEPPVDGRDLALALDLDLQRAARLTLEHPELPPEEKSRDSDWFEAPVGAIVMITPDGQVLAAASVPREPGEPRPGRDGQRAVAAERTLRMHTFQPIGSIFKPFAAAWALDRLGLDPREELECAPLAERGGAGYGAVRCHNRFGHGRVALVAALQHSCNSYFAALGERYGSKDRVLEMARAFGFDQPTRLADTGLGAGLVEDWRMPAARRYASFPPAQLQQAANGLAVIEGTPMQVARAFAALVTGALPELRFDVPSAECPSRAARPLAISRDSLELVRRALVGVVLQGSAAGKHLGPDELGFQLAAKTGSADYFEMNDELRGRLYAGDELPERRKHTWLAGWFPAEDPVAVVVVYLHDVAFTSSHTAVHVASQLLRRPEVADFVREARR